MKTHTLGFLDDRPRALLVGLCMAMAVGIGEAQELVLETTQPPSTPPAVADWPAATCGHKAFLIPGGADWEWTPVISGFGQHGSVEPISGYVLNAHPSETDVPFTHPFGKLDWNYLLLPDAPFTSLLAPGNSDADEERTIAAADAANLTPPLDVAVVGEGDDKRLNRGLLAVEHEVGLIPEAYRPRTGDRVAVFGRWIVDCGHDNWQTEIHPPLLTVRAPRAEPGNPTTLVQVIANPYLVDQEFPHGGLRQQLMYELALVNTPLFLIPFTDQVKAQPGVLPPTAGTSVFSFRVKPNGPAPSDRHRAYARMHLTARPGVIVQPFAIDSQTLGVVGIFTDALTMHKPIAGVRSWDVRSDELTRLHRQAGDLWGAMVSHVGGPGLGDFVKGSVLARGIRAILYDAPAVPDLNAAPVVEGWLASSPAPWGQNPVRYMDQPFPLIGWIEVGWRVPTSVIAEQVDLSVWRVVQRHLDEMPFAARSGRQGALEYIKGAGKLFTATAPAGLVDLTGRWSYRARAGGVQENGKVWLRSNGRYVEGLLNLGTNREERLDGEYSGDGKALRLVRTPREGASITISLVRQGTKYVGVVEGAGTPVELVPQ